MRTLGLPNPLPMPVSIGAADGAATLTTGAARGLIWSGGVGYPASRISPAKDCGALPGSLARGLYSRLRRRPVTAGRIARARGRASVGAWCSTHGGSHISPLGVAACRHFSTHAFKDLELPLTRFVESTHSGELSSRMPTLSGAAGPALEWSSRKKIN